jgi:glycerol-3-phosphate dehydrogenase
MKANSARNDNVHGSKGAFVGGDWVPIEECGDAFNITNGSGRSCGNDCAACPRSQSRRSAKRSDGGYDIVIIGAGCIGSAIARELSKTTASVLLLEAADDVTQGATKGNSGIVHAGYDDKPGSIKAKYCWPGNQMFPQLDKELHFGFQRNGSLVVAKGADDERILEELMERGAKNGVENIRIIGKDELLEKEPYIHPDATAALYSPDAGTITPYEYAIALAENACDNGVEVRIRREVVSIKTLPNGQGFRIDAKHWEPATVAKRVFRRPRGVLFYSVLVALAGYVATWVMQAGGSLGQILCAGGIVALVSGLDYFVVAPLLKDRTAYSPSKGTDLSGLYEMETIHADFVVNAAGCSSDKIAAMVGDQSFKVKPRYGEYILLHKDEGYKCAHTLFPTPHPFYGKGVLVQNTLWGNLILGPTARDTLQKNQATGEYEINPDVRDEPVDNIMGYILSKCRNLVPSFDPAKVIHTFSGARAKNTTGDWVIGPVEGVPNFLNAASIDSPGIAASPAIAADVVNMLRKAGANVNEADRDFNPYRAPIIQPKDGFKGLKMSATAWFKEQDSRKNVVCKCERVTEAEVIEACRRSLPIDSTQAIRKRTRAGMGHCQGDPANYDCESRVAAIMARELGVSVEEIGRRPWPASSMLPKRWLDDRDKNRLVELSDPGQTYKLHGAAT